MLRKKMTCKGICIRDEAVKPPDGYRYCNGQKRCRVCDLFINWDGVKCPCCGMTLAQGNPGQMQSPIERGDKTLAQVLPILPLSMLTRIGIFLKKEKEGEIRVSYLYNILGSDDLAFYLQNRLRLEDWSVELKMDSRHI